MEGLIPLVYKAIKKTRSRQQHTRSLSVQTPYFFVDDGDDHHQYPTNSAAAAVHGSATQSNYLYITPPAVNTLQNATTDRHHQQQQHRRHKSLSVVSDRSYSFGLAEELDHNNQQISKQLVRFRSHRSSFFSCISGAA